MIGKAGPKGFAYVELRRVTRYNMPFYRDIVPKSTNWNDIEVEVSLDALYWCSQARGNCRRINNL